MIHRPSQGASQRLEPQPEPASSSGHERRSYTTAWDTIVGLKRDDVIWIAQGLNSRGREKESLWLRERAGAK
jgi:hypothetical protein